MKKNILSVIALIASLCTLIFACVAVGQLNDRIENLENSNASLAAQIQQLSSQQDTFFTTSDDAAYSSLMVESWSYTPGNLTITGGYVQVQLPQIAASTPDSALTLRFNGEILHTQALELNPDETGAAFEAELHGLTFDLPELTGDDLLELWLDVTIAGETQSVSGAEWYLENGQLLMVAG